MFFPTIPLGSVELVVVEAGAEILGPDGNIKRVLKGRAVQLGRRINLVQADYDELKRQIPGRCGEAFTPA